MLIFLHPGKTLFSISWSTGLLINFLLFFSEKCLFFFFFLCSLAENKKKHYLSFLESEIWELGDLVQSLVSFSQAVRKGFSHQKARVGWLRTLFQACFPWLWEECLQFLTDWTERSILFCENLFIGSLEGTCDIAAGFPLSNWSKRAIFLLLWKICLYKIVEWCFVFFSLKKSFPRLLASRVPANEFILHLWR